MTRYYERFVRGRRLQYFVCAVVPLALFWGILIGLFGLERGLPPVRSLRTGAMVAVLFSGGLGASLWAAESRPRQMVLLLFSVGACVGWVLLR